MLIWPALALLLYATFVPIPLLHVGEGLRDHRFLAATTLGNFVAVPLLVWGLLWWLPEEPAVRLGVAMVLVMPCTDRFIPFTQLGHGNSARAIAVTPFHLLAQFALLPLYLWWLVPSAVVGPRWELGEVLLAAGLVIALPLAAAALSERGIEAGAGRDRWRVRLAWWPVRLLSLVVVTQVASAVRAAPLLGSVVPVFVAFLLAAGLIARGLAQLFRLPRDSGRTWRSASGRATPSSCCPSRWRCPMVGRPWS